MISRSQMNRQLYEIGGLSSLYNIGSKGQKPIYPRISDIESSLSNAEQRIGDPSFDSFGGTSDGGFGSPMGGELPPIQQAMAQGPLQIPSTLINPVRDGVDTSQLGSPRTGVYPGSFIDFGQLSSLFGGVGDPRLGAPDVANSLQQVMRGGAADGGLMNRQLYANGTGIAELLKMNQGAAQDELTEEQAFALMPKGVKEAFASMLEAGASPEEARRLISEQIAEMSRSQYENMPYYPSEDKGIYENMPYYPSEDKGIYEPMKSQNIPEYYDSRLQILNPEQMREEMQNPSMPGYAYGGLIGRQQYGLGSLVKSVTKGVTGAVKGAVGAVKDIASSDLGKAALAAAAIYAGGGGFSPQGFSLFGTPAFGAEAATSGLLGAGGKFALGQSVIGGGLTRGINQLLPASFGSVSKFLPGAGTLLAGGLGLAAGSMLSPQQIQEGMKRNPEAVRRYLRQYYINTNPEATESEAESFASEQTREYAAEGGLMGRQNYGIGGMITKLINENPEIFKQLQMASPMRQYTGQYYGNLNPGKSVEEIEEYVRENAAYGGPMGELRTNQEGVKEIDYRQTGGFVPPIGIKEKADDVPAMLSNNEFVFTADAVRNAGGGDVNKGAQKMYSLMKTLENGGMA